MWVGKSIFTRTVQWALALIGPEIRSVQSAFRLGPKDVPFLTGQKGNGKSRRAGPRCGGRLGSSAAPRKARKAGRGSDEAANSGRVLFLVYLVAWTPAPPNGKREPSELHESPTHEATLCRATGA